MPISGKELAKLFLKQGFEVIKSGGKGSHTKLRKCLEMALRKQLEEEK